jgi:hypothetical protein
MHDELIERRLRAALSEEAGSLAFTITPAELERRLALRHRTVSGRRITLLLAAAVGISIFGVGGALSGLFSPTLPSPTGPVAASIGPESNDATAVTLPSLNELVADDPGSVIVAQAHGPAGGPSAVRSRPDVHAPSVVLGTFVPGARYRVSVACVGPGTLDIDIGVPGARGPAGPSGPSIACDGAIHEETVDSPQPQSIGFALSGTASWRAVVRGPSTIAQPSQGPDGPRVEAIPPSSTGQEELLRLDGFFVEPRGLPWGRNGLEIQEVGPVPGREGYNVSSLCSTGSPVRLVFGSVIDGAIVADTETQFACDPTRMRDMWLGIAQPDGSQVFIAATPEQPLSMLITSTRPPFALTHELPGWQLSGGFGPELAFDEHPVSFGGAGEGEDHVQVVLACTGTQPIEVVVEDGTPIGTHQQRFVATCTPEGSTTSQIFKVAEAGVVVRYVTPSGVWTTLSILVPSN